MSVKTWISSLAYSEMALDVSQWVSMSISLKSTLWRTERRLFGRALGTDEQTFSDSAGASLKRSHRQSSGRSKSFQGEHALALLAAKTRRYIDKLSLDILRISTKRACFRVKTGYLPENGEGSSHLADSTNLVSNNFLSSRRHSSCKLFRYDWILGESIHWQPQYQSIGPNNVSKKPFAKSMFG